MPADEFNVRESGQKRARWEEAGELDIGGGSSFLHQTAVSIANANVITLPTTPVELIAAQGANTVIIPDFAVLHLANWAADYGDIDAGATIQIAIGSGNVLLATLDNAVASSIAGLLAGGGPDGTFAFMPPAASVTGNAGGTFGLGGYYESDLVNIALNIKMTNGAGVLLSGGNAAQSLIVSVSYKILNTVTGEFE